MLDRFMLDDAISFVNEQQDLLSDLSGKRVLVTGATGLIGSHVVISLIQAKKQLNLDVTVLALVRSEEKAAAVFQDFLPEIELLLGDVNQPLEYAGELDYIIHGASVTASKAFVDYPVDTIMTAISGTKNVLELARVKGVQGFVYLSSLEIYGHTEGFEISELDLGRIDLSSVRSSYSEGKRMAECLCVAYAHQYQLPITIARLTQTFGPGVVYDDNRVFAQFARAVIEGKDIVLHTTGETVRNYCYTKDAVSAILTILLRGKRGEAYNVANQETAVSIKEMADLVVSLPGSNDISVVLDLQDVQSLGYNPTIKIKLLTAKLEALGWQATTDLKGMYASLMASMVARKESSSLE